MERRYLAAIRPKLPVLERLVADARSTIESRQLAWHARVDALTEVHLALTAKVEARFSGRDHADAFATLKRDLEARARADGSKQIKMFQPGGESIRVD